MNVTYKSAHIMRIQEHQPISAPTASTNNECFSSLDSEGDNLGIQEASLLVPMYGSCNSETQIIEI